MMSLVIAGRTFESRLDRRQQGNTKTGLRPKSAPIRRSLGCGGWLKTAVSAVSPREPGPLERRVTAGLHRHGNDSSLLPNTGPVATRRERQFSAPRGWGRKSASLDLG